MNVLHLVPDEKFIDFFANTMNLIKGVDHRYVVRTENLIQPLLHIRQVTPYRRVGSDYFLSETMRLDLASCDVLVVHFLTSQGAMMINAAPEAVKIVWSGWGADYYHLLPGGQNVLYEPKTRRIVKKLNFHRAGKNPLSLLRLFLRPFRQLYVRNFQLAKAIKRVHLFSSPIPEDFRLLKNCFGNSFSASYVQLNYGSVEKTFAYGVSDVERGNILVGNSATPTGNHVEIFQILANYNLGDRKVIVPLSYGDIEYRKIVLDYGHKFLGRNFSPIFDFLPLDNYNKLLSSCSVAIMNHRRQQALGNIGSLLYGGARLFLNPENVIHEFFAQRGACISSTRQLLSADAGNLSELTSLEKIRNRMIIEEFWGGDRVNRNALEFIESIRNDI